MISDLGQADKVIADKDDTTIVGGKGDASGIKGRIEQIRVEIENTTSDYDKEKLQERLARLAGGVAIIRVGAGTETELKEKKHRVEDALSATRAAVEEGIVPGGGVALLNAVEALDAVEKEPGRRRPDRRQDPAQGAARADAHAGRERRLRRRRDRRERQARAEGQEQPAHRLRRDGRRLRRHGQASRSSTRPRSPAAGWRMRPPSPP